MNNEKYKITRHMSKMINNKIASDIVESKKIRYRNDEQMRNDGINFARSGLTLEDAPEDKKNDQNFIIGYEKGKRLMNVDDDWYRRGAKAYFDGIALEDVPESSRENEFFIQGYEDAMTMNTARHR